MPLIFFIVSGMLLLTSVTKAEDNLKDVKLLCRYELYTRAVEPGRSAWTIYTPQGLEFIDNKNMIMYTIASGIDNFNLVSGNKNYPIDHKISVSYGYKHNIPAEEIGKMENLCITKRCINSSKGADIFCNEIKKSF